MRSIRNIDDEIVSLRLEARDTLEEMAARAPMRMDELAAKIEDIILGGIDYGELEAVREDAIAEYKSRLVVWLKDWATEERDSEKYAHRKSHALLEDIAQKIENGEI